MICHFSCGSTSAIATAITLKQYPDAEIIYADPGAEHSDNMRFLKDCEEKLFNKKVTILKSDKYNSIFDIFEEKRFLASPKGAPCTTEMKKLVIRDYLGDRLHEEKQMFGYDTGEEARIERFKNNNPEVTLHLPLIDMELSKSNCLALLQKYDIELPEMYNLGYANANCIGCVKAENLSYWAAIRKDFPDVFDWYAKFERQIGAKIDGKPKGAAINKRYVKGIRHRLFLDELPDNIKPLRSIDISCGYSCGSAVDVIDGKSTIPKESKVDINNVFNWLQF